MTQHVLENDTLEDRATMRRLAVVIGGFIAFTAVLAVSVAFVAG